MQSGRSKEISKYWNLMKHISSWPMLIILICWGEHKYHKQKHRSSVSC